MRRLVFLFIILFSSAMSCFSAWGQNSANEDFPPHAAVLNRLNDNVIYLMGGQLGGGYIKLAHDVSVALKGEDLRVLPIVGNAAVQNVRDVLFLRGIDLALTTVQALNLLKESGEYGTSNLESKIAYVAPLFPDEMHVIVRRELTDIRELSGKKVGFNNAGSQTALLSPKIFAALGIEVDAVNMPQDDAIEKIKSGELAASVCICPKPIGALANIKATDNLKLIGVDYIPELQESFSPGIINAEDYPNLMADDQAIETIATQTLLITYNWKPGTPRYQKVERFVEAFYLKFGALLKPPRMPLWKSVNLAATVKGWQRFPAAQQMIEQKLTNTAVPDNVILEWAARVAPGDEGEQKRLLREFLEWRQKQALR